MKKGCIRWGLVVVSVFVAAAAALADHEARVTPVVRAVRKASPAVVNISSEIVERGRLPFSGIDPFFDEFFRDFFGELPRQRRAASLGSGVLIDPRGNILTNQHVIRNASRIRVTLSTGEVYDAELVGADARTDLAVLRVRADNPLPYLEMGRSDNLMIGETVVAIGNPFGLSHTVTTGVVSAVNRTIKGGDGRTYADFIQTDASINPGNSGGPLLNIEGALIGINAAIYKSAEGIGFAIPIDKAHRIVDDLLRFGEVHRAWLGLQVQEMDSDLADYFELQRGQGLLVRRVFEGGPAEKAGIRRGELLLEMDGRKLSSRPDYLDRLAGFTADNAIRFTVRSADGVRKVSVRAQEVPEGYARGLARTWIGVDVTENSPGLAKRNRLLTSDGMVVVKVVPASAAAEAGIEPGDVILRVNDTEVAGGASFDEALLAASHRETVVLLVQRGPFGYQLSLSP